MGNSNSITTDTDSNNTNNNAIINGNHINRNIIIDNIKNNITRNRLIDTATISNSDNINSNIIVSSLLTPSSADTDIDIVTSSTTTTTASSTISTIFKSSKIINDKLINGVLTVNNATYSYLDLNNGDDNNYSNNINIINNNNNNSSKILEKLSSKIGRGLSSSEVNMIRNQVIIGSGGYQHDNNEDLLKQMEYDKFMNEIWIGIVLTLIVISLVFCICSCFLYHQFRQWKRNYRQNVQRNYDIESVKLNPEDDDPVPNYTLVSGLPSYEAALELLRNSSSSTTRLLSPSIVPPYQSTAMPSIFHVFSTTTATVTNEKDEKDEKDEISDLCQKSIISSSIASPISESTIIPSVSNVNTQSTMQTTSPLSSSSSPLSVPVVVEDKNQYQQQQQQQQQQELISVPSYEEAIKNDFHSTTSQTTTEKSLVSSCGGCDESLLDTKHHT